MNETKSKTYFVIKMLDAVRYVHPEISSMNYWVSTENGNEYVRVSYKRNIFSTFDINVTDDSLNMMAVDVWRGIARRFT